MAPHPSIWKGKRDFNIAIDLTLSPYHGQPYEDKDEIVRGMPKSGTIHFHGYATVSIVRDDRRYGVALHFIEYGEEMADIVRWLIKRLKMLKIRIRRVFLDKGFCSQPVFKVLHQHKLSYITPIPVRGQSGGVRSLLQGKSRKTSYTFNSPKHGQYTVQAVVVPRYSKGRYARHKSKWFACGHSACPGLCTVSPTLRHRVQLQTNEPGACAHIHSQPRDPFTIGWARVCLVQSLHFFAPTFVLCAQATFAFAKTLLVILAPLGALAQSCD